MPFFFGQVVCVSEDQVDSISLSAYWEEPTGLITVTPQDRLRVVTTGENGVCVHLVDKQLYAFVPEGSLHEVFQKGDKVHTKMPYRTYKDTIKMSDLLEIVGFDWTMGLMFAEVQLPDGRVFFVPEQHLVMIQSVETPKETA